MAEVLPFSGIRYNQSIIKEIGAVICPPHDVIPPQLQDEVYRRSDYNFVRIEFGREYPQDNQTDNRYSRAAATMQQWFSQNILQSEATPAFYIHEYHFTYKGKNYKRRGIIGRVRLEEWSKKVIFPHESTFNKSKTDRLSLLWACQANTSPILALFQDQDKSIDRIIGKKISQKPDIKTKTINGERHDVWVITEPELTKSISSAFEDSSLYIADGHHRYESALKYKQEREACSPSYGTEGYNFVMMTLVEFNDPGLLIFPSHRLIRGASGTALRGLIAELPSFFKITAIPLFDANIWQRVDNFLTGGLEHVSIAIAGLNPGQLDILELKENTLASSLMPVFHSDIYKRLDVSIVDHIILEKLLNIKADSEASLVYTHDKQDAIARLSNNEFQLAVLLNPVKAEVIKAIADAGDRMPRKSTYFYPKEPAGLVFNKL